MAQFDIPISTWKMLNEAVPQLIKECSENSLKRLSNIIQSKENHYIFVRDKEPNLSLETYNNIVEQYKTFTTWLLGQLYYILGCDKIKNNECIIETQLSILKLLSRTHLHVYNYFALEYCKSLSILNNSYKEGTKVTLKIFIPFESESLKQELNLTPIFIEIDSEQKCRKLINKTLLIIEYILLQNFTFCSFDPYALEAMNNLNLLLLDSDVETKLKIFKIHNEILKTSKINHKEYSFKIVEALKLMAFYFQQMICALYTKQIPFSNFKIIEEILIDYLNIENSLEDKTRSVLLNFLYCAIFNGDFKEASDSLKKTVSNNIQTINIQLDSDKIEDMMKNKDLGILQPFKDIILKNIEENQRTSRIQVSDPNISQIAFQISQTIYKKIEELDPKSDKELESVLDFFGAYSELIIQILIELRSHLVFFEEPKLILSLGKKLIQRKSISEELSNKVLKFFLEVAIACCSMNCDILFDLISIKLLKPNIYKTCHELSDHLFGIPDPESYKKLFKELYVIMSKCSEETSVKYFTDFLIITKSGLLRNLISTQMETIERTSLKIVCSWLRSKSQHLRVFLEGFPRIFPGLCNKQEWLQAFVLPLMESNYTEAQKLIKTIPAIICTMSSEFVIKLSFNKVSREFISSFSCCKCKEVIEDQIIYKPASDVIEPTAFFRYILTKLNQENQEVKIAAIESLESLCNHFSFQKEKDAFKSCLALMADPDKEVRNAFVQAFPKLIDQNPNLDQLFETIMNTTKLALQRSDFELQGTMIDIIEATVKLSSIVEIINILLYLIMTPTSKYSLIAVSKAFKLAEAHKKTTRELFSLHKKAICETIAYLCCNNYLLIKRPLNISLEKVSVLFGFCGVKDFLNEASPILPPIVMRAVNNDKLKVLVDQFSSSLETDSSDLLITHYGKIFLYALLRDSTKAELRACLSYTETITGLSGSVLRKRNFRKILTELFINLNNNKERAMLGINLLAKEEADKEIRNLPEHLQSHFLGVLQYFDARLVEACSESTVLSLADLLRFMGGKHITKLRFKILAMLQSLSMDKPELNCEVWEAFVYSCEVEAIAPQLAGIFASMLPLLPKQVERVNAMFKYLIVNHYVQVSDYILDLFFVCHPRVRFEVSSRIQKAVKDFEEKSSLRDKIVKFLKYLEYESLEVRILGFKRLKGYLEDNREELDQLILGYNGIDGCIVELVELLRRSCMDKEEVVRVCAGDLLGELGAVEPSHFPRGVAKVSSGFCFGMNEDGFVIGAINELVRGFQAENSTQNMDRFALAIQEILRWYQIGPDPMCARSAVWNGFSDGFKEVMVPFLSSRYVVFQPSGSGVASPIFGSTVGMTFDSWLHNWTYSLIKALPDDKKELLQACLPSMKTDNRILLYFLPYILLHVLQEGRNTENCFVEFSAIFESFKDDDGTRKLEESVLNTRVLRVPGIEINQVGTSEGNNQVECTRILFLLLDFLDRWIREWKWQKKPGNNNNLKVLQTFLGRFCKLDLAKCNYSCGEYARALMHLEDYMESINSAQSQLELLSFLAEIYAQLDEPDGVAGVAALQQTEPSIEQRILALEVSGKLADAIACYERIEPPLKLHHLQGLVQSYLDLDKVNTALNFIQGAIDLKEDFGNLLVEMQAEPMYRLGRYDDLQNLIEKVPDGKSWGVQIGKALISFKNNDRITFDKTVDKLCLQLVDLFASNTLREGAYQHGYQYISKLHVLSELKQVEKVVFELLLKPNDQNHAQIVMKKLINEMELRLKVVQQSVKIVEPLLCLRRVVLDLAKGIVKEKAPLAIGFFDTLLGDSWLQSAKIARAAGVHQQAYSYTLKAEGYSPPRLFLEKAKLHWLREEHEQALTTLKRSLELIPQNPNMSVDQKKIIAEAKLLYASYNDSISNVDTDSNTQLYRAAIEAYKEWEKSLVCLAQYLDRIFCTFSLEDRDVKGGDMQLHIINYFGKSLQYSSNYVYQSLPRLLSIWFDYGTRLLDVNVKQTKEERQNILFKMTKLIDSFLERLPPYIFLTAFSQIVSRICHPQKEVYLELKSIVIKLLLHYPQQSLWAIISVVKSGYAVRSKRCIEILSDSRLKSNTMNKLVRDFTAFAEKLIELCNKELIGDVSSVTVSSLLRALPRMICKEDFSEIMMPTYKFRKLVLPNPDFKSSQHNPFPNVYVHIVGIEEEITVLQSLQKPRKISLRGSDGKCYIFMLKPKDDLRKDFRLMEFNDIVNQLLAKEPEARQRRLNIRLYSVAPLNEECGLIEWVPNLVGLRPILMDLYKQKGIGMKGRELKESCCNIRDPLAKKREIFQKILLPKHPPVLSEWFRKMFPDPQNWLTARTAYIRTTAVMSIAGYILGLGDRHGENILLDSTCGDVVHVDFNCLFNKGETFEWPERVPFRLTQNMVTAMGPLGVEGTFRKAAAATLRVLRNNTNTLMSIVTPFVYDPLVSWPKNVPGSTNANAERTNAQALEHIKNIELRLQGIVKTKKTLTIPLSIEGQTNQLINEALSTDNLCQMYIGWGPYL